MKLRKFLKQKQHDKSAVLAINFYNYKTLCAVLSAYVELDEPLILQTSKSTLDYLGLDVAIGTAPSSYSESNTKYQVPRSKNRVT